MLSSGAPRKPRGCYLTLATCLPFSRSLLPFRSLSWPSPSTSTVRPISCFSYVNIPRTVELHLLRVANPSLPVAVHPIRAELSKTSDMMVAVRISILLCSVIYAAIGFFGYLLFGESTMADVLSNFDRDTGSPVGSILNDAVRLSYVLHLALVFPLLFFSLRISIDELLLPQATDHASGTCRFVLLTVLLLGLIYTASILFPSIWTLFQFFGSTTAVCISLIFPAAIVLRDVEGISKRRDKVLASVMLALAVVTSSIAIGSNIVSHLGSNRA
ncbi:hypothetical protein B296_00011488 [Ensete ventricosum]|uniref:Amino acid transporter transmembrane domain-containing protein n=1 Tax=Ensete ventricosum TaxID=4639 RepID=A0A427AFK2_ENSVE|nr:hypothetical protein B296_00011488 [Ensete ventricosum]